METKRISEEEIKGLPVLATGYKMFKNDWTTKYGTYDYKDENGNILGSIHKVEGKLEECNCGLHFSKLPHNCFNFYESVQWNKFAKVEAYKECIDSEDGKKSVASIIRIVEIYSFDEFIELIQKELQNSDGVTDSDGFNYSDGVTDSDGVNYSKGVTDSCGVNNSKGVTNSYGVNNSKGVNNSYGVTDSYGVNNSKGVTDSYGINYSKGVTDSYGVNNSKGVTDSCGVNNSKGVTDSYGVDYSCGVNNSDGVNDSFFCKNISGASKCIFCCNLEGIKLRLFNKKISLERFIEVKNELCNFSWYPKFNNAEELKGNLKWHETNIPDIVSVENKIAYSSMPQDMVSYIRSLPEFDEKIFNKIIN